MYFKYKILIDSKLKYDKMTKCHKNTENKKNVLVILKSESIRIQDTRHYLNKGRSNF